MTHSVASVEGRYLELKKRVDALTKEFDPNQARDSHGQWTDAGGGSSPTSYNRTIAEHMRWLRSTTVKEAIGRAIKSEAAKGAVATVINAAVSTASGGGTDAIAEDFIKEHIKNIATSTNVSTRKAANALRAGLVAVQLLRTQQKNKAEDDDRDELLEIINRLLEQLDKYDAENPGDDEDDDDLEKAKDSPTKLGAPVGSYEGWDVYALKLDGKEIEQVLLAKPGTNGHVEVHLGTDDNNDSLEDVLGEYGAKVVVHQLKQRYPDAKSFSGTEGVEVAKLEQRIATVKLAGRLLILKHKADFLRLKFDPNQPRDENGQWTEVGGGTSTPPKGKKGKLVVAKPLSVRAYHGSIASFAESINSGGIKVKDVQSIINTKWVKDPKGGKRKGFRGRFMSLGGKPKILVTATEKDAQARAAIAANKNKSKPIVVELHIPKPVFNSRFGWAQNPKRFSYVDLVDDIPAEWVAGVKKLERVKPFEYKLVPMKFKKPKKPKIKKADEEFERRFVVVELEGDGPDYDPDDDVTKFDPNQPRASDGKWTDTGGGGGGSTASSTSKPKASDWKSWANIAGKVVDTAVSAVAIGAVAAVVGGAIATPVMSRVNTKRAIRALPALGMKYGVPPSKVKLNSGVHIHPIGGVVAGLYSSNKNDINVWPAVSLFTRGPKSTIAHEMTHLRFDHFTNTPQGQAWLTQNQDALIAEGSSAVSKYSKMYWDMYRDEAIKAQGAAYTSRVMSGPGASTVTRISPELKNAKVLAIHETLAEMSSIREKTGKLPGGPAFKELYKRVFAPVAGEGFYMYKKFDPNQPRDENGQWSETGAGGGTRASAGTKLSSPKEHREEVRAIAHSVATKLGYDSSNINLLTGSVKARFGSKTFAIYDPKYKRVNLFYTQFTPSERKLVGGIVAHEIMHSKFDTLLAKNDPSVRSQLDGLTGGVSPYSIQMWKLADTGKVSRDIAVHETLAEMARIEHETGKLPGSRRWKELYRLAHSQKV